MNGQQQSEKKQAGASPLDQYSVQPRENSKESDSPYYKSIAPSISMPKGGGAIKGIDEKFTVNAINGTAGLDIGFPLTPGRGGFTPALSLSYNSGSGNSEFGLGWNLSLPSIRRRTDKKLPRYNDVEESDVFLLAGAEDLVPELDSNNQRPVVDADGCHITRYRPRIEGLFARIEHIREQNSLASWWRVTTKDNITTYYGLSAASRITDPESDARIYAWLPDITVDHKGNVQQFVYIAEDLRSVSSDVYEKHHHDGTAQLANTYLKRVLYGNIDPYFIGTNEVFNPVLPSTTWLFEAVLDYGDHLSGNFKPEPTPDQPWPARTDAFSDFHAGFEIRTYRRCKRVLMFHRFQELNSGVATLVRSLELTYKNDSSADAATETDYIVAAVQRGYTQDHNGNYVSKTLPALQLDYIPFQWNTAIERVDAADFAGAPQGLIRPYQWIDFEGEGISGILTEQTDAWFYKSNLGDAHFKNAERIALKPSFNGLGSNLQWQDLDADGRRQIVSNGTVKGFWELDDDQRWQPFRAFARNLNIDWNNPFTQTLDLDGDGRADVLITEDRAWTWYANEGTEGYGPGGNAPFFHDEEKGPVLLLRDAVQSIFLADINGDGLTDLVRIRNGEVCYWPNKGYGYFGRKVTMAGAPVFTAPDVYNPLYLTLADISGTGAADLVYTGRNRCVAWINLAGNAWSDAYEINPLPGTDSFSKIAVLDFLGNGTGCLVWSSPLPQHAGAPIQYIDLMGGNKPYLLQRYTNGTGKQIDVEYKSSTRFYLEDKQEGIQWATRLPFPVHCISKLTTTDLVSDTTYSQSYRYRHGYYDHEEREFRGFGYVETLDMDRAAVSDNTDLDQYPVLTRSWFHTGAWMREGTLLDRFKKEYFPFEGWDDLVTIAAFPQGLNPQEQREAYRALKGSPLRQEVYALDGSPQEKIPYTVTATAYEVKTIQRLAGNRYASFLNLQQQSVAFSCERNTGDPRILHSLTLQTDEYGNVLQSAQVAYKRKDIPLGLPQKVTDEQGKMHISAAESVYTVDAIDDTDYTHYRLRLPYESKSYEAVVTVPDVESGKLWTPAQLKAAIDAAAVVDFSVVAGNNQKRLLQHTRSLFLSDDAQTPLTFGALESLALPYESYQLAYTPAIITQCYGTRTTEDMFLFPGGVPPVDHSGGYTDPDNNGHYWLRSGRALFTDPLLKFYTPEQFIDPWGNTTTVSYWGNYWLLPGQVTDSGGNTSSVTAYCWRSLQPLAMQDINDNISEMCYDALGMAVAMALRGKGAEGDSLTGDDPQDYQDPDYIDPESAGDITSQQAFWNDPAAAAPGLLKRATWRCVYDLDTLPVAVGMIARQQHYYAPAPDPDQGTQPLIRISYSDGLGRVLMHKAQAEPDALDPATPRWVGSGRTIYNNKGSVVMQYEPYFSLTHACDTAEQAAQQGVSPRLHYDALGRLCLTELPDGTFTKTQWTSWMQTLWDNNDTVLDSTWYADRIAGGMGPDEQDAATKAAAHANTPTVLHTDTLARPFYTIQQDGIHPDIHSYVNLDILGLRLSVIDGNHVTGTPSSDVPCISYHYNMVQAPCLQISMDSGTQRMLLDAGGQPLFAWDTEDRRTAMQYDNLRRLNYQWLTDYDGGTDSWIGERQLLHYEYGDTMAGNAKEHNLRGKPYLALDGGGLQLFVDYDFKGNLLAATRQLPEDKTETDIDWYHTVMPVTESFSLQTAYDALNRPVSLTDPGENITVNIYDKGGALKKVRLNGSVKVQDIHYDAKGQRLAIWYGNQSKTSYTYDAFTFRLRRLLTVNLYTGSADYNRRVQDLYYFYDPVGNITRIKDAAEQIVFFNNNIVSPGKDHTYDALYRLIVAKGRERINNAAFGSSDNAYDTDMSGTEPLQWDTAALQNYEQRYAYDAVGNILSLQHIAGAGSYTRDYTYNSSSNRLLNTAVGSWNYGYTYDARGNMTVMPHLSALNWNRLSELSSLTAGTSTSYYQYSGGQRIRKYTDKGSLQEERIYLGSYEIYRKFTTSSLTPDLERITLHISDDTGRIAMLENRTIGTDLSPATLERYIYSDHLGSSSLEMDETARVISYEEYHPYGTTAYQASNATINALAKRYRYTGKERDEESGLYYHGARYYIPWLCRWTAVDPLESKYAGMSSYNYSFNNPVVWNDLSGAAPTDPGDGDGKKPKAKAESIPASNLPKLPPINIPGKVDNARDVRGENAAELVEKKKAAAKRQEQALNDKTITTTRLDQRYIGEAKDGQYYNVSQREIAQAEYESNEAWGANIRGGLGGAIGSLVGGKEGAAKGAVIDQLSFGLFFSPAIEPPVETNFGAKIEAVEYGKVDLINTVPTMKKESPNEGIYIMGLRPRDGKLVSLAELDRVSVTNKFIAEEKTARGLYINNPRTGKPQQTPEQWAFSQIFESTVNKIKAIENGQYTAPNTGQFAGQLVPLKDIQSIRDYRFIVNTTDPSVIKVVNNQLLNLANTYPGWTFRAFFYNH